MVMLPEFHDPNAVPMTAEEIVEEYMARLKPENALKARENGNGNWREWAVSPLIKKAIHPNTGQVVDLALKSGKHAAVYCRVSTIKARGDLHYDGYSAQDQMRSGVIASILKGHAFHIYSDAGISGFYPTDDPVLIAEMREKHARYYREAFEKHVLRHADTWNTPAQVAGMKAFLEHRVRAIEIGDKEALAEWNERQTDRDWDNVNLIFALRYQHHKGGKYRPALHALVDDLVSVHTIYITDADRLSRNQSLLLALVDRFRKAKPDPIEVISSEGIIDWISGDELKDSMMATMTAFEAESTIRKTKKRVLPGIVGLLRTSKPHSALPFWLVRTKDKFARFTDEAEKLRLIQRVIELGQNRDHMGESRIATMLQAEGFRVVTNHDHPRRKARRERRKKAKLPPEESLAISGNSVGTWLRNPLLYGSQVMFGREWEIHTSDGSGVALMSREEFWQMHQKRQAAVPMARGRDPKPASCNGFIYCPCGAIIRLKHGYKGHSTPSRYRCACPSSVRKNAPDELHAIFDPENLDSFFVDLISAAPALLQPNNDSEDSLKAQEQALEEELRKFTAEAEKEAREKMALLNVPENTPTFHSVLNDLINYALGQTKEQHDRATKLIENARQQRETREAIRAQQRSEDIANIRILPPDGQNRAIKAFIDKAFINAALDTMTIQLHSGVTLPPVQMTNQYGRNNPSIPMCIMPDIKEYLSSISAD